MLVCNMKSSETLKTQLYTQFQIPKNPQWKTLPKLAFLGSCFSTNISQKFDSFFISNKANPFGTQFSPDAIAQTLEHIKNQSNPELTLFENQFHALLFDSQFCSNNSEELLQHIQFLLAESHDYLKSMDMIFITLGSAWIYQFIDNQQKVGNCHKIPQKYFEKKLLSIIEIQENILSIHSSLKKINPHCKIVFTVSPVRHLRDGIIENAISKSHLISAIHHSLHGLDDCDYFPSYEIFNEELRDHRFFESDLAHPNQFAIDYIFQRLLETYSYPEMMKYFEKAQQLLNTLSHKVKSVNEKEIVNWQEKLNLEKLNFKSQYPDCTL